MLTYDEAIKELCDEMDIIEFLESEGLNGDRDVWIGMKIAIRRIYGVPNKQVQADFEKAYEVYKIKK